MHDKKKGGEKTKEKSRTGGVEVVGDNAYINKDKRSPMEKDNHQSKESNPIWYLIIPFTVTFVLNIGLIFNIPNQWDGIDWLINWLSEVGDNISIHILVGSATIFVIFFSFIQLFYTTRYIPPKLVIKYILKHNYTCRLLYYYLSLFILSSIFICLSDLYRINIVLLVSLFLVSLGLFYSYFRWITEIIKLDSFTSLILKDNLLNLASDIEDKLKPHIDNFKNQVVHNKDIVKTIDDVDVIQLVRSPNIVIFTDKSGVIENIDVEKIIKILSSNFNNLERFYIYGSVGSVFPKIPMRLEGRSSYTIIQIYLGDNDIEKDNDGDDHDYPDDIDLIKNQILRCITINENYIDKFINPIKDLSTLLRYTVEYHPLFLDDIIKKGRELLLDDLRQVKQYYELRSYITGYLVDILSDLIVKIYDEEESGEILLFLYDLRSIAAKSKDYHTQSDILDLMYNYFFMTLTKGRKYNRKLPTQNLYMTEIVFAGENAKELENELYIDRYWDAYYKPLINKGIEVSAETIYKLIKHSYCRPLPEIEIYLSNNIRYFINFTNVIQYSIGFNNEEREKMREEVIKYHAKLMLYLAIIISRGVDNGLFPKIYYLKYIFPMSISLINYHDINSKSATVLDNYFWSDKFVTPVDYPETNWFNEREVEESVYSTKYTENFDIFWILLSFYFNISGGEYIPRVPQKLLISKRKPVNSNVKISGRDSEPQIQQDLQESHVQIWWYIDRLEQFKILLLSLRSEPIEEVLGIDRNEKIKMIREYEKYLTEFIKNLKTRNVK